MPVPASKERRTLVGKLARASSKFANESDGDVIELRRDVKAATIRDHIIALADSFPPLSEEQRSELALLLRGSGRAERTDAA